MASRQYPLKSVFEGGSPRIYLGRDPEHERRLEMVVAFRVASRDANQALDEIAAAATRIFDVPSAFINISVEESEWYHGQHGLPAGFSVGSETPLTIGKPTSRTTPSAEVMEDAALCQPQRERFLGARFYAGVPLVVEDGKVAGTLTILDSRPRQFTDGDLEILYALGSRAIDEVDLRAARERAEKERLYAERRSREKSDLAAVTAHELKNPLTVIKGISVLLEADPKFPLVMRTEFMHTITRQVDRMLRIIDETLDLGRLENGCELCLNRERIDLAERLINVASFYDAASPRHRVTARLLNGSHSVLADRDKMDQVFFNLVSNAVKYSPEGGEVTICSELLPGSLHVTVTDQGLGMTGEQVARLFGRFTRFHIDVAPEIKGTGLGLYLTKALVDAHHGKIWVETEPGVGSRFHVELPSA